MALAKMPCKVPLAHCGITMTGIKTNGFCRDKITYHWLQAISLRLQCERSASGDTKDLPLIPIINRQLNIFRHNTNHFLWPSPPSHGYAKTPSCLASCALARSFRLKVLLQTSHFHSPGPVLITRWLVFDTCGDTWCPLSVVELGELRLLEFGRLVISPAKVGSGSALGMLSLEIEGQ